MAPIDILTLQDPKPSCFAVNFTKRVKEAMKRKGWAKGCNLEVTEVDEGFLLKKNQPRS
jgi:hypothetical protein